MTRTRTTAPVLPAFGVLLALSGLLFPAAVAQEYTVIDVGTLGGPTSAAAAINNLDQVVGGSTLDADPGGDSHAFLWDAGGMIDLGTLGGSLSGGHAINEAGQVAGWSEIPTEIQHPFLWEGGTMSDLVPGFPATNGAAWCMNEAGQVAGHLGTAAVLWDHGTMVDLGSLGGSPRRAWGINDAGHVVGEAAFGPMHAFFWEDDGDPTTQDMRDLGLLPGGVHSRAHGIDNLDRVVGWAHPGSNDLEDSHAVLWENLSWDAGGSYTGDITDLGTLPGGVRSYAWRINDAGQVVGYAMSAGIGAPHAFLYDAQRGMRDLNDLIPTGSGWLLRFAMDINEGGRIVGAGIHNGLARGFLLVPAPEIERCGTGAVNAGCGPAEDVLLLNGNAGGSERTVRVTAGEPLSCTIREPTSGHGDGRATLACVYAWTAAPRPGDTVVVPKNLGLMCFGPFYLATRTPSRIWNAVGFPAKLGRDDAPGPEPVIPDAGLFELFSLPSGLPRPLTATLQGIVEEGVCTQGEVPYSLTNGLVLEVSN